MLPKLERNKFMMSSWCLEFLANLYLFAFPGNKNLNIFEYNSKEKKFNEQGNLIHTGFGQRQELRGVFLWKGKDGIALVVFGKGQVLPVDIRKKEIHTGYDKELKDSYQKHIGDNDIALRFAFQTSLSSGEEGIVAGDSIQRIYYFLDFDKALDGLVPQKDKKDSTLCKNLISQNTFYL